MVSVPIIHVDAFVNKNRTELFIFLKVFSGEYFVSLFCAFTSDYFSSSLVNYVWKGTNCSLSHYQSLIIRFKDVKL